MTKSNLTPAEIKEVKEYIESRKANKTEMKYIRRDALKKFDISPEEWTEHFAAKTEEVVRVPQSQKHPNGMRTLKNALDQSQVTLIVLNITKLSISSASLKEGKLFVTYDKQYEGVRSNSVAEECGNDAHIDLVTAFKKLIPHFVIICDQKESTVDGIPLDPSEWNAPLLESFKVTGFILKGNEVEDNQSIQIIGQKKIKNRSLCFNSPLLKFNDKQFPYEHLDELKDVLAEIDKEIHLYLTQGKFAPPAQQVLELEESEEEQD